MLADFSAPLRKLKETLFSVAPIVGIVVVLGFTLVPLEGSLPARFAWGTLAIIVGLAIFLLGVDIGLTPIGQLLGHAIARSGRLAVVISATFVLGLFISVAEPDLHIYGGQVEEITDGMLGKLFLVLVVSLGIAVLLTIGMVRIIRSIPLKFILLGAYLLVAVLGFFAPTEYLAISFDASGATTGALTVPFILAMATGVSAMKKDSRSGEADAFGLVGIASAGAILAVLATAVIFQLGEIPRDIPAPEVLDFTPVAALAQEAPRQIRDVALGLAPILTAFVVGTLAKFFPLTAAKLRRIILGLAFSYVGLVIFLTGVNAGFMDVGRAIGETLAANQPPALLLAVAFLLGVVTILAEPAVYVLMDQVEDVTAGAVHRKAVMFSLALGVGVAVVLSTVRVLVPALELWHILLPGYVVAVIMMRFAPPLFTGIAFDSGGVASGPMTATFVLAFAQGAAAGTPGANVVVDGLGVIATVAMTPLIAIQILGLIYSSKTRKVSHA